MLPPARLLSLLRQLPPPPGQGEVSPSPSQASALTASWPPAEVPVLVMVTPINEFSPTCVPRTFRVREDARPHTLLGSVVGTDADYPHGSLEYHTPGGPAPFTVDQLSGTCSAGWDAGGGSVDRRLRHGHPFQVRSASWGRWTMSSRGCTGSPSW